MDAAPQDTQSKKASKTIPVTVIAYVGDSAIVEWEDSEDLHRCTLPADIVKPKMTAEELANGIPYGLPLAEIVTFSASAVEFSRRMHQAGLWTADDIRRNPQRVFRALQAMYAVDVATLMQKIRTYEMEVNNA
ncbi:MAG: hypothetical protein GYA36_17345 [Veillonellaceae bacterium]|nr:hypothetical protein [Veillonellaceae bacterium]